MSEGYEKSRKKIKKPLDKIAQMCYTIIVKRVKALGKDSQASSEMCHHRQKRLQA